MNSKDRSWFLLSISMLTMRSHLIFSWSNWSLLSSATESSISRAFFQQTTEESTSLVNSFPPKWNNKFEKLRRRFGWHWFFKLSAIVFNAWYPKLNCLIGSMSLILIVTMSKKLRQGYVFLQNCRMSSTTDWSAGDSRSSRFRSRHDSAANMGSLFNGVLDNLRALSKASGVFPSTIFVVVNK
ncbi:hypothetical protein OGAPHI_003118 [Ogataea philodendri]|uniref:Uncharacterized protein n=1 Tax=Ogataea philodendri TaxID=1378263 RepID=A0A9P8PA28_9ASCO|nr:uncharacterized protein OGAPHI_003118 [Ogataea philodendri]KAH3667469.1 hypothetical protein OGAPHI_003118 [Ogataea philodendri]